MRNSGDTPKHIEQEICSGYSTAYTIFYSLIFFVAVLIGNIPAGQYERQLNQDAGCRISAIDIPHGIGRLAPADQILGNQAETFVIFPATAGV